MLDLSPTKLLIIFVVVVILLGPKRLPEVARQLGAGWRKVREMHTRLDSELRQVVPDLPSSQDIVRFARSPVTLLNQLADVRREPVSAEVDGHAEDAAPAARDAAPAAAASASAASASAASASAASAASAPALTPLLAKLDTDDPNLN